MKGFMEKFKVIIVEDVKLELKGTEEIFRHEIPNAGIPRYQQLKMCFVSFQIPKKRD